MHIPFVLSVVESDGLKKTDAWFVESVVVINEKGEKWLCPCNQWLSLYHTDCQVLLILIYFFVLYNYLIFSSFLAPSRPSHSPQANLP